MHVSRRNYRRSSRARRLARLIELTANPKHRAILMAAYGAGLRLSELCRLKLSDIDAERMNIRVEQGKGAKDRYTLLSSRLLAELRRYWASSRRMLGDCGQCKRLEWWSA